MLQRLVRHLQQQTLLRIHLGGFPRQISKNSASKASISLRNEPHRVVRDSAAAPSGEPSSKDDHRSAGTSPQPSGLRQELPQRFWAMDVARKRHPRPMTAIGSSIDPRSRLTIASAAGFGFGPGEKPCQRIDRRVLPELDG